MWAVSGWKVLSSSTWLPSVHDDRGHKVAALILKLSEKTCYPPSLQALRWDPEDQATPGPEQSINQVKCLEMRRRLGDWFEHCVHVCKWLHSRIVCVDRLVGLSGRTDYVRSKLSINLKCVTSGLFDFVTGWVVAVPVLLDFLVDQVALFLQQYPVVQKNTACHTLEVGVKVQFCDILLSDIVRFQKDQVLLFHQMNSK